MSGLVDPVTAFSDDAHFALVLAMLALFGLTVAIVCESLTRRPPAEDDGLVDIHLDAKARR